MAGMSLPARGDSSVVAPKHRMHSWQGHQDDGSHPGAQRVGRD